MEKKILAIIPARGGSKGLPRKNIKKLKGIPLIAYTINAARECEYVDRVVVSTDDEEIADVSRRFGADVPCLRPSELAEDTTPTIDAILHMINYLKENEGYSAEYILLLQCTSPLRNSNHIREGISKLMNSDAEALISVCEAEVNPYWTKVFDGDKLKSFIDNGVSINRRQDLPDVYRLNGAMYLIKTDVLIRKRTFQPENLIGYIMDHKSSVDIDTELDFKIAEVIMSEK